MPEPKFVGNSSVWKQQRGSNFGTTEEGTDYIDLKFRGKSELAIAFKQQYKKGTVCPEPGFEHCRLTIPPTFDEEDVGFTTATLRFEGPSPLEGTFEGSDAQIDHKTVEAEFVVYTKVAKDDNNVTYEPVYRYFRNVVTAKYTKATKPTGTRYASELDDDPDPKPEGNVKQIPLISLDFTELVKDVHYKLNDTSVILNWTKTADGVYEIVEEHVRYIVGNLAIK